MTALRPRILARQAVVRERLAVAEAAAPFDGKWWTEHDLFHLLSDEIGPHEAPADAAHIAANDPATVIAECQRELAGIDADLALLDWVEGFTIGAPRLYANWPPFAALLAHYPEEGNDQ